MKKTIVLFLLSYHLFGMICLPFSDFSALVDLPAMYRHCKTTEDKDLTPFDFVTDHLVDFDCIFDKHDNGDEQKPHAPFQYHHLLQQVVFNISHSFIKWSSPVLIAEKKIIFNADFYNSNFISGIFRPPIV